MAADFSARLNQLYKCIHEARSFVEALPELSRLILEQLDAERITVYQRGRHDGEIVSRFKIGNEVDEIRLPLSMSSIAGYVAMSQRTIRLDDVYDSDSIVAIHPDLRFDNHFDRRSGFRTRSMLVLPIKYSNVLIGVLQLLNKKNGSFTYVDVKQASEVAEIIAQKFRYELNCTQGPFEHLIQSRKVSAEKIEQLKQRAAEENVSVAHLLISELKLSPEEVGASLELHYQVPFAAYGPDVQLPLELLKKLNLDYLRSNLWVPLSVANDRAVVLIDDPSDVERIMEIEKILNARGYEFRVGFREDILRFLGVDGDGCRGMASELEELVGRLESDAACEDEALADPALDENAATIVQLVNKVIMDAHRLGASDVHVEPGDSKRPCVIRMRIDGVCREVLKLPQSHIRAVIARIKVLSRMDIAERRKPQDGKFMARMKMNPLELRVATIPTIHGESAVLRLLPPGGALPLGKLNLSERNERATRELAQSPHGLFLVVGPTGSGKTTTLHAILGHINTADRKIWTVEDPVEITQPGLQQVQVEPKIGLNFAAALRAFLRADPDVILIGETRDAETAHSCIEASLTGHLVFSTLHTNSASETVTRLLDFGLDPRNFADALLGVLSQRLVRTLCPNCKEKYRPGREEIVELIKIYGAQFFPELKIHPAEVELYKAAGCAECGGSGYRGRTGIHELLLVTPEMRQLISMKCEASRLQSQAIADGMRSLRQDGAWKVLRGMTDLQQLKRVAAEKTVQVCTPNPV